MTLSEIEVRTLAPQFTACVRHRIRMDEVGRIPEWIGQTMQALEGAGLEPAGMPYTRTFAMDADGMDVEVGWPVAREFAGSGEVVGGQLPGGRAAVGAYFGPYDGIGPAYEALSAWCTEHGHDITGAPWESYFTDPHEEPDPSKWRTDIAFPIAGE
ncbi:MAG: GyrI-like domain-containing protein [Dehalococcoidia bacterium]